MNISTWAAILRVSSDSRRTARYRALESWYRQTVLGVPPGLDRRGRMQDVKLALRIKRYR